MAKVNHQHSSYTKMRPLWQLIADCLTKEAVKNAGELYLPKPNAEDNSKENDIRYAQYGQRAVFYNVTSRTLNGLVGEVFSAEPTVELPSILEVLEEDIDGSGVSLCQQAKSTLSHVVSFGRCGLLADYPPTDGVPTTLQQLQKGYIRPLVALYDPRNIINWRTTKIGGRNVLSLVVLEEEGAIADDGFEEKTEVQYRVLRLTVTPTAAPVYSQEIWVKATGEQTQNGKVEFVMKSSAVPTDGGNKPLDFIPFIFVGALNNDIQPDEPPLYDLAALNVAHYRNSADYEEACFITGQPTLITAGLTQSWVKDVWKDKPVLLGSRAALTLPSGASASLLQVSPNSMPMEAMKHKEEQMIALGARLVEPTIAKQTLGEASMEEASELSILQSAAQNVSEAYELALSWALQFLQVGDSGEPEFELSKEFALARMSAADRAQTVADWQAGMISWTEARLLYKQGGVSSQEDGVAKAEIEAELGTQMGFSPNDPNAIDPATGLPVKPEDSTNGNIDPATGKPADKPGKEDGNKPA